MSRQSPAGAVGTVGRMRTLAHAALAVWRSRRSLTERLELDIGRSDDAGPDWPTVVEDAVLRQDMQWIEESLAAAEPVTERREQECATAAAHE